LERRRVISPASLVRPWRRSAATSRAKGHLDHCIESAIVGGDAVEQRRKSAASIKLLDRSAQ
jgi:hypothetical protein